MTVAEFSPAQQALEVLDDLRVLQDSKSQKGIADQGFLAVFAEAPLLKGPARSPPEIPAGEQTTAGQPSVPVSAAQAEPAEGLRLAVC